MIGGGIVVDHTKIVRRRINWRWKLMPYLLMTDRLFLWGRWRLDSVGFDRALSGSRFVIELRFSPAPAGPPPHVQSLPLLRRATLAQSLRLLLLLAFAPRERG
jgi:hypothetical protein